MSALSLRIPDSLHEQIESLKQFNNTFLMTKLL